MRLTLLGPSILSICVLVLGSLTPTIAATDLSPFTITITGFIGSSHTQVIYDGDICVEEKDYDSMNGEDWGSPAQHNNKAWVYTLVSCSTVVRCGALDEYIKSGPVDEDPWDETDHWQQHYLTASCGESGTPCASDSTYHSCTEDLVQSAPSATTEGTRSCSSVVSWNDAQPVSTTRWTHTCVFRFEASQPREPNGDPIVVQT